MRAGGRVSARLGGAGLRNALLTCRKNSSMSSCVQFECKSHRLAGWLISEM